MFLIEILHLSIEEIKNFVVTRKNIISKSTKLIGITDVVIGWKGVT